MDTAWQEFAKQQAQQRRDLFRPLGGLGNIEGSIYGKLTRNIASLGSPGLATNKWSAIGTVGPMVSYKTSLLSKVIESSLLNPRNPLPGVSGINHTLASEAFKVIDTKPWLASLAQPRIDTRPWFNGLSSNVGLGAEVARAFQAHGLDETLGTAWTLRRVWFGSNPAVRSILKNTTSFGPIVVPPDYDDYAPFDYHPDLRDVIPETGTKPEKDLDTEERWAEIVAIAQGVAQRHCRAILVSVTKGGRVVFQVVNHPVARTAAAGTLSGYLGIEIGGAAGAMFTGGVTPVLVYFLTRRR